jgi:hypothetical protein
MVMKLSGSGKGKEVLDLLIDCSPLKKDLIYEVS